MAKVGRCRGVSESSLRTPKGAEGGGKAEGDNAAELLMDLRTEERPRGLSGLMRRSF